MDASCSCHLYVIHPSPMFEIVDVEMKCNLRNIPHKVKDERNTLLFPRLLSSDS